MPELRFKCLSRPKVLPYPLCNRNSCRRVVSIAKDASAMCPASPYAIAFDSANGDLYVTDVGGNTVSVISGKTNTAIGGIAVVYLALVPLLVQNVT